MVRDQVPVEVLWRKPELTQRVVQLAGAHERLEAGALSVVAASICGVPEGTPKGSDQGAGADGEVCRPAEGH